MEIEENRGLNDKKASEEQFTSFVNSVWELSLFSLLSHTIAHSKNYCSTLTLEKGRQRTYKKAKESKDKTRNNWIKRLQQDYFVGIELHV